MNSLPEAPLKLKDQTTMKETMKANLESAVPTRTLPPATAKSDRELLELAAKAAGIDGKWGREGYIERREGFIPKGWRAAWNPLQRDGDALRLAVKLGLEVYHTINCDEWTAFVGYPSRGTILYAFEGYGTDPLAATRRAIVRAAAAIGEMNSSPLLPPKG